MPVEEPLWTVAEVAAALGLGRVTVYKLIYHEGLPYLTRAGAVRCRPADVRRWWEAFILARSRAG